jgi:two-component system, OmpR family, response regulator VicR
LQKRGFHVTAAYDGAAGLKSARSLRPNLVLLDLMLLHIHGFEVCRHLRTWMTAPILILTAMNCR